MQFKILLNAFTLLLPTFQAYISTSSYSLISSSSLRFAVPCVRLSTVGSGAFSRSPPKLWNCLLTDICNIDALPLFKSNLKTCPRLLTHCGCLLCSNCYCVLFSICVFCCTPSLSVQDQGVSLSPLKSVSKFKRRFIIEAVTNPNKNEGVDKV